MTAPAIAIEFCNASDGYTECWKSPANSHTSTRLQAPSSLPALAALAGDPGSAGRVMARLIAAEVSPASKKLIGAVAGANNAPSCRPTRAVKLAFDKLPG